MKKIRFHDIHALNSVLKLLRRRSSRLFVMYVNMRIFEHLKCPDAGTCTEAASYLPPLKKKLMN